METTEPATGEKQRHGFVFHGNAPEYFGIWIVNLVLTVLTLGIYSAWAKVRRNRYFYGNAELAGARFSYLATPMQILIGRILVVVFLVVFNLIVTFLPIIGLVLIVALLFVLPELMRRGLRFSARTAAYRNVRFDFDGGYGGALVAFILAPLLAVISFGLLAPVVSRITQRYIFSGLTYGGRRFVIDATTGQYYRIWWLPMAIFVAGVLIIGAMGAAVFGALAVADLSTDAEIGAAMVGLLPLYLTAFVIFGVGGMLYAAGVRNVAFNAATLDERHDLVSHVHRWQYVWVMVSNFIVTLLSVGLMRPWAAVRHARFLARSTALDVSGDLANYTDAVSKSGGAFGAEYVDVEGLEFGL